MQFFKKNQKRIVIFFLFAVLLVCVRLTIGKLQETIDNSPEANVRITSTGIDVENHQLLLDAAVPLKGWKKPALLLKTSCCSTGNRRYQHHANKSYRISIQGKIKIHIWISKYIVYKKHAKQ